MSNRKMSKYITERMFLYSQTAISKHINNVFSSIAQFNIGCLFCQKIIDPIGDFYFPKKYVMSSGFRGKDLNTSVGGDPKSDHCINKISLEGAAGDGNVSGVHPKQVFNDIISGRIKQPNGKPLKEIIDQCIYEERHTFRGIEKWVHLGRRKAPRRQFMVCLDGKTYKSVSGEI